ncbi:MAG: MFS transporter [Candidatus Omnitrophota bacterium]|nr:MFS transporter [Candidatus Omnitrophota bacterium]
MSNFRIILKNRDFLLLWSGQIISQIGDRLNQMALIAFVYLRAPGSSIEIAKILSFTIMPVFIIGPIAGAYVDRWNRRQTMFTCDFLRAILILFIPLFLFHAKSLTWVIYLIIFIVFSISRFFVPAKLAIIPDLVKKEELLMANSLINTTGMIAAILGFGISGIIVEKIGAQGGFYLDTFSFLVSGTLIFMIAKRTGLSLNLKKVGKEFVGSIRKSLFQEIKEGILYFIKNKEIRLTTGIIFVLWSALGAVYVVAIVFIQESLHSATKDLGLLAMFLGLGLLCGSLFYGRFGQRLSQYKIIFVSLILSGLMLIVFALGIERYPSLSLAATLSFALGLFIAPIMIASNTIIHNVSHNHMMGKIFSSLEIVMHLGFVIFMFVTSFWAEKVNPTIILVTAGFIVTNLGVINLITDRRKKWSI